MKKLFEKAKLEIKFRKAGDGHTLAEDKSSRPSTSQSNPGPSRSVPSASAQRAGEVKLRLSIYPLIHAFMHSFNYSFIRPFKHVYQRLMPHWFSWLLFSCLWSHWFPSSLQSFICLFFHFCSFLHAYLKLSFLLFHFSLSIYSII